jgi:hypothetical protein
MGVQPRSALNLMALAGCNDFKAFITQGLSAKSSNSFFVVHEKNLGDIPPFFA